ncbi:unnamed protein product [Blepharisma stoltei]|uniref:Uncharacterized protein n=1 Tax=Blepharisma stoltei TaxID=1481888 RepID=A0AAU9JIV8_9CILI|nr:unnamed protein product [Blepharisma stoltei]
MRKKFQLSFFNCCFGIERMAYFSRENEIFCISIPSLEFKSFRKFEVKRRVCLKNSWDKKSLIALFDDEIISISFSDLGEAKMLVSGKFTKIDISNKGYFALISSEDRLVLLSPESEKIAEVAIEPKSIKLKF